jgi:WD40 repeat protein
MIAEGSDNFRHLPEFDRLFRYSPRMIESTQVPTSSPIRDLSVVHHDGASLVVCAEESGEVWTWSPSTGEWLARSLSFVHAGDPAMAGYPDAGNEIGSVAALSLDGELLLAAGGHEQEPGLWDLGSGELRWRTPADGSYIVDVVALDDAFVIAQQYSLEVRLWTPEGTDTLIDDETDVFCLGAARAGGESLILIGGSSVDVRDAGTLDVLGECRPDENDGDVLAVTACALEERTAIVAVTSEGALYVWDLEGPRGEWSDAVEEPLFAPIALGEPATSVAVLSAEGRPLVVTPGGNSLRLWDGANGTQVREVDAPGVAVVEQAVVDGRPALVAAGKDGVVRIWDESELR